MRRPNEASKYLTVIEGGLGICFLGMVVGYLPALYGRRRPVIVRARYLEREFVESEKWASDDCLPKQEFGRLLKALRQSRAPIEVHKISIGHWRNNGPTQEATQYLIRIARTNARRLLTLS